ncbi:toxin-antitoxin system, toxin component family protein [Streptomyces sp. NPDC096205]|uniref:toxin-antitoxin system, toxin component family protein n=1 Tax=Streptomyces sp. NPDC096205 TaxID=3366081 RepID=UPI003826DC3C
MGIAGARRKTARVAMALRRPGTTSAMRGLARDLSTALGARPRPPADVHELCRVLCEEMSALRGGRPVKLRFERFPDDIEVTGLCVQFRDFDLVIVEERAEASQQLVILGHELWHLHAGHRHHHGVNEAAAARALARWGGSPLAVAARNGSRQADEAQADDFGHRLATAIRPLLSDRPEPHAPLDTVQRSMGYRRRGSSAQ